MSPPCFSRENVTKCYIMLRFDIVILLYLMSVSI